MPKILIAPPGAADGPISHGKDAFRPYREDTSRADSRWLVETSDEAAKDFTHNGGFQVYAPSMRRRLSGEVVPIVFGDGDEPFSMSYDGDNYTAELQELPDGSMKYVMDFPAEGVGEVVGAHPGYAVLSLSDHQPPPVHPGKGYEMMARDRAYDGKAPLQGGGIREHDLFPSNSQPAHHPDGVENPERAAEIAEAEAAAAAEVPEQAEPPKA